MAISLTPLRRLLIGRPLATAQAQHERLSKRLALAVFSSDALSSTAYATEEILRVLLASGTTALGYSMPIAIGITVLLAIVAISYNQTIHAYPSGGGAYIVAKENLGAMSGLIAAASLLIDYILTVAVSVAAGVAAINSQYPALIHYTVPICLACVAAITLANLRGLKESGAIFAIPTYSFIVSMFLMIGWGAFRIFVLHDPQVAADETARESVHQAVSGNGGIIVPITMFVILKAYASGCTALTGVEAISNGIPAFKKPESDNAAKTLTTMVIILGIMFLGMTFLAQHYGIATIPDGHETLLSQVGRKVFGGKNSIFYSILQFSTFAILIVAANTSYADFPRLASLLARDRYLPRQLADLGDRLVFNNGIVILAVFAAILIVIFKGAVDSLIPLYAVGVFTSFTLSQGGMVRHWLQEKGRHWQASLTMNLLGAIATFVVLVVIGVTKFNAGDPIVGLPHLPFGTGKDGSPGTSINYGAWLVVALIPLLVWGFNKIKSHYDDVARFLKSSDFPRLTAQKRITHHTVLVLVPGLHRGIFPALAYAQSLSPDARAVHIETDPGQTPLFKELWQQYVEEMPLIVIESPYRSLRQPVREYVAEVLKEREDDELTIIVPELVATKKWWHRFLHNSSAQSIRRELRERSGVVVTSFRYFADDGAGRDAMLATPTETGETTFPVYSDGVEQ